IFFPVKLRITTPIPRNVYQTNCNVLVIGHGQFDWPVSPLLAALRRPRISYPGNHAHEPLRRRMNVRKAVILAAGYGTRLLPASKAVPKEMLPLVDRPVIDYIVEEALAAGLDQIIMVTNASKTAIECYFDRDFELESVLESGQKQALLAAVKKPTEVSIVYVHQKERLGNGHAVTITRD